MTGWSRKVVHFYNQKGTAEQWIREGKCAVKWTRLSCHDFKDNQARLQLFCAGVQSGELPASVGAATVCEALVADHAAREADQDRSQGGETLGIRDLPDGRGGGSTRVVRSDPGPHPAVRCTATVGATGVSVAKVRTSRWLVLRRSAGNRPPQHSEERQAGRLRVQSEALSAAWTFGFEIGQESGRIAASETAYGKSRSRSSTGVPRSVKGEHHYALRTSILRNRWHKLGSTIRSTATTDARFVSMAYPDTRFRQRYGPCHSQPHLR